MKAIALFIFSLLLALPTCAQTPETNTFYLTKSVNGTVDEIAPIVKAELKKHNFGVITEIDMQKSLKEKLDVAIPAYRIYGVCNVKLAYQLMQLEDNIGVILPCKMVLKQKDSKTVEVVFIDPQHLIEITDNKKINAIGLQVKRAFEKVLAEL
ncbi:MAG: DUF302 domain-containing protein [Marinilabiliaceae bacterium]|nr:DUF302 domain-containing protein [Marinilabiliaceae bacterium]